MATGEDDKKKVQGKGFAGLSSLVSDVDTTPRPATKKPTARSTGTSPGASRPAPQAAPPKPQPAQQQPYKPPQQPGSGSIRWQVVDRYRRHCCFFLAHQPVQQEHLHSSSGLFAISAEHDAQLFPTSTTAGAIASGGVQASGWSRPHILKRSDRLLPRPKYPHGWRDVCGRQPQRIECEPV